MKVRKRARIEHAGHTDDAVLAELGDHERGLGHGVEGIGHHDDDAVGGILGDLLGSGLDDFIVGEQQIVAAHTGLAREAGGDDGDIGIRRRLIIVGAGDVDVVALDGAGLEQIEPLTLRNALYDVHQDDIGEFLIGNAHRAIGADVTSAHNRDFLSQD